MTITIALRSDFEVIISRGFKSIFNNSRRYFPAKRHSSNFNVSSAGVEELFKGKANKQKDKKNLIAKTNSSYSEKGYFYLYGRDIPIASMAEAIVFAVYIPPQAPAPGQELRTTFFLCSSLMDPLTYSP